MAVQADEALQSAFAKLAATSNGRLRFRVQTVRDLGADLGLDLGSSPNSLYDFDVAASTGPSFRCIAYTIVIDASKRPATRVEALGHGLAADDGKLFALHPFLLVFDYVGKQFMAVSATALFGAFAREVVLRPRPKAESATFSLTPNFSKRTISLYATVPAESIWYSTLSDLTLDHLSAGLARLRDESVANHTQVPEIVAAISARIKNAAASTLVGTGSGPAAVLAVPDTPQSVMRIPPRVWRMVLTAIRSSSAVILVGPPGTGKTALLQMALQAIAKDPTLVGQTTPLAEPLWATPDESWTARELVGGETVFEGAIEFRAGWVLRSIAEQRWLVLDEANRADMDRIFGGLLTWIAGGSVSLGFASTAPDAPSIELGWNSGSADCATEGIKEGKLVGPGTIRYLAGTSWRLLGTYNALDAQRVFRFGAALGRRFVRVPIPAAEPDLFAEALAEQAPDLSPSTREAICGLYAAHYARDATQLGPALFLSMSRYLRVAAKDEANGLAITPPGPEPESAVAAESPEVASDNAAQALAEAYVVNIGTWLAHLEPRDREELEKRAIASAVFTPAEWTWITTMVRALA